MNEPRIRGFGELSITLELIRELKLEQALKTYYENFGYFPDTIRLPLSSPVLAKFTNTDEAKP